MNSHDSSEDIEQMPRICAKVEGKGNGIKTVIVNMPEVAKALGRPATCKFIRKFVLCPECDNPETELIVSTKRNTISQGCKACGYHGVLDFNHKLNTFILKNPPTADTSGQVLYNPETELIVSTKRNTISQGCKACGYHGVRLPRRARLQPQAEHGTSVTEGNRGKRSKRSGPGADLTEGAKCMTVSEDSEKNEKQRMDLFYAFLKQRSAAGNISSLELLNEAERYVSPPAL
ncbi:Eukaryotic translation initiation factor 5 [Operophtera brumata]|uniref:Eukaryotic translation initiation factor 5 n=1 Tax=Operophtera brumata TaxID=104452 RepID=A0A0L7LR93_OPEBR|nr:Eukaryotic translation initiation factor 5 [Operophtera brumata]